MERPFSQAYFFEKTKNTLGIQRWAIADYARAKKYGATATNPLMRDVTLSPEDSAVLAGVEEGYHAYQWLTPHKRRELEEMQKRMDREYQQKDILSFTVMVDGSSVKQYEMDEGDDAYGRKAEEVDAVPVKRQAMSDLKLGPYRAAKTMR